MLVGYQTSLSCAVLYVQIIDIFLQVDICPIDLHLPSTCHAVPGPRHQRRCYYAIREIEAPLSQVMIPIPLQPEAPPKTP
jgi:hypothetical protein